MSLELLEADQVVTDPADSGGDDSDDLNHLYCCDPDVGLCGVDLTTVAEVDIHPGDPDLCVVCEDLADQPCERCGA